jgi:myosin heavy subunit
LDAEALCQGLCSRLIVAGGEKMVKHESADKAKQGRDALAKALYLRLFEHVVQCANSALRVKGDSKGVCMQVL